MFCLEKDAVMYFNFDNTNHASTKSTQMADIDVIHDKSGHFNDATLSNKAHISSRAYGNISF